MEQIILLSHRILPILLVIGYAILFIRFFRNPHGDPAPVDTVIAYAMRYLLVLLYVSGLLMSYYLGLLVNRVHHVLSLIPLIGLIFIRYIPKLFRKGLYLKTYAWFFLALFIFIIVISLTARLSYFPTI